jgi:hypothetical protein
MLIEGRAPTQTAQSFASLCAPSPPDITLTRVAHKAELLLKSGVGLGTTLTLRMPAWEA